MRTRLKAIEISNFKSFVGRWDLTPLMPWNAITAPNGSGKSSLIDAITFGLGENENVQLRINNLEELVPQTNTHESRTFVSLTFSSGKDTTVFERSLVKNRAQQRYESLYTINEQVVDTADYLERLKALGINIKAKDFVVYQGNINDIIDASPQDRLNMLETASGSLAFKERYDYLTQELSAFREKVVKETSTKRKLRSEMNKYKAAAEKSRELKQQREQFQRTNAECYLLQLKIIDLKNETLNQNVPSRSASSRIEETKEKTRDLKKTLKKMEVKQNELLEESQQLDKLNAELCKKNNQQSDYEMEIKKLKKWLEDEQKLQDVVNDIEGRIEENEKLLQMFHSQGRTSDDARVSEYEGEYERLLKEVRQQMGGSLAINESKLRQERKLKAELDLLTQKGRGLDKSISDHRNAITRSEHALENYRRDYQTILEEVKKLGKEKQEKSQLLLSKEELESLKNRRRKIEEDLETLRICSEKKRGREKQRGTLEKLKAKFPDSVHDRVANLCRIPQEKYKIAVAAALDKNLDAIIVEDDATAAACLEYLEQERIGFETFYSIESASPPTLDRNLLSKLNSANAKLVYDLVKFDQQYEPVIRSIVRSTVLCQTLEDAWSAMDKMQRLRRKHSVVTLAGEMLTARFVVSAGFSERKIQSDRIKTVNEAQLEVERQCILEKLTRVRDGNLKIEVQRMNAEHELKLRCLLNLKTCISETEKKNEILKADLEDLKRQHQQIEEKKIDLEKRKQDLTNQGEHLQREMDKLRETSFQEFCQQFGIENIGQFESMLASKNDRRERRKIIEGQLSELKSLKRYEESRSKAKEIPKWKERVQDLEEKQKDLQLYLHKLNEEKERCDSSVKKLQAILEKETRILNAADGKRKELFTLSHQNDRKTRQVSRIREELSIKRREIVSAARFEGVSLPQLEAEGSSSQSSVEDNQKKFDYSHLRSEWQKSKDVELLEKELWALEQTLERTRVDEHEMPDIEEQLNSLKSKLREVDARLESLKKQEQRLAAKLREVDKDRSDAFIPFFDKAISVIDNICKEIYNSNSAHAILSAVNPSKPYLDGIRYDCTPARKKYRNVEKLSGGEKAMAGLIFLFALQESRSSSLVILDEVDGALDPKFVQGFVNYLKKLKRKHQVFMISHNPMINSGADTMICVTPNISSGELESVPIMVDLAGKFTDRQ
ncbi:structural maintenance of chromosomes protein 1A-like [Diachasma alloeum]|uniref:structural maintenance of chromosomes protein 1A-like n=1 Tax=Diachasma alloeum TaxID=454923 RepID=UPI0010FB2B9B|nr:structural maintenance of chromosomes protein 1A-like [Diachasma alloeum]